MKIVIEKWYLFLIYCLVICFAIILLVNSDEGKLKLTYTGTELVNIAMEKGENSRVFIAPESRYQGTVCRSKSYALKKGSYIAALSYMAQNNDNNIILWNNGVHEEFVSLPSGSHQIEYEFELKKDSASFQLQIYYAGTGELEINSLSLGTKTTFYTDSYFSIVLFISLNIVFILFYFRNKKKPINREALFTLCILGAVSLLASSSYFNSAFVPGDDCAYHFARIEGLKDTILAGQFPAVIYPEALQGNGYLGVMYPYLFLYIPAILRLFGVSLVMSYKALVFLMTIATTAATYSSVKSVSKSRISGILITVLYVFMPYRLTVIYERNALGEALSLIFLPIVLAGLYHVLVGDRRKWPLLLIGFSGLIQSHVLNSLIMLIICAIGGCFWFRELLREKRYKEVLKAAASTVLLNLWFIIPFLYYFINEDLWSERLLWTSYTDQSLNLSSLFGVFYPDGDNKGLTIGIPITLSIGIVFIRIVCDRIKTNKDRFLLYLFLTGIFLLYMVSNYFPGRELMKIELFEKLLTNIQFPWRLITPAGLMILFAGGIWLAESDIFRAIKKELFFILTVISILLTFTRAINIPEYVYGGEYYSIGHPIKVEGILSDNLEAVYVPEWRIIGTVDEKLITELVLSDPHSIAVSSYKKEGTKAYLGYTASGEREYAEFPIQAYRGYSAYDEDGKALTIRRGNNNCVRIALQGDSKKHFITVEYKQPVIFTIAVWISLAALAILIYNLCITKIKKS